MLFWGLLPGRTFNVSDPPVPKLLSGAQLGRNARSRIVESDAVTPESATTVMPAEVPCATGALVRDGLTKRDSSELATERPLAQVE
jgi:hypothetical protein